MILIGIHPYSRKKLLVVALGLLICLRSITCFGAPLYLAVKATPYDKQMTRIRSVFSTKVATSTNLTLAIVNRWIEDLREIPYGFSPEWKTPSEVESGPVADCKGKAVALYGRMQAHGADNLRLVIGKRTSMSRRTHAWLEWTTDSGTYVLDPTINWSACRADGLGSRTYIPFYAYSGDRKYRAGTAALYAKN